MRHHAKTGTLLIALALGLLLVSPRPTVAQTPSSLDSILKEVSTYDGGIQSAALWKLRDYVQARKDDEAGRAECESKLLAFLRTTATAPAKLAAAHWLRIVASERAVPALEPLLLDPVLSDDALYALQRIPGAEPDKALLRVLPKATGAAKIAVIGALGQRGCVDAVPVLAPLVGQPEFARPAAIALGAIGSDAATQALAAAFPRAQGDLKTTIASSLMECAEKQAAADHADAALRLYEPLAADAAMPAPLRRGAAIGRISASGTAAPKVLMSYLDGSDAVMQEAAIARVAAVVPPEGIAPVCALLPRLTGRLQVQLLAVLSGYPRDRVLPAIVDAARSDSPAVRIAAMKALSTTGDASAVPFLVEAAAKTRGDEQTAARTTLATLKGREIDEAIVKMMAQAPAENVQAELLLAIGERRIFSAKPAVAAALAATPPRLRLEALRSLRAVGTPSDIPTVVTLRLASEDDAEQTEAEKTIGALAQKIADPDGRASSIRMRLMRERDPQVRAKLLALLPLFGDNSALPLVRTALRDADPIVADAAVRALVAWRTATARDDVFGLASESKNETHRLLAIQGLVRLIGLDPYRDPKAAVADLRRAASFASRPEEHRLVLSALAQFPCQDGIDLATGYLGQADVKAEAQAAIDAIKQRMSGPQRRRRGTQD